MHLRLHSVLLVWRILCPLVLVQNVFGQNEGDVRLVDGPNRYEGRPEIFREGVWLSLCRNSLHYTVPQVICKQLGYDNPGVLLYYANSYGEAPGETFRKRITCSSSHTTLSQCSVGTSETNCDPRYTLGISCNASSSSTKIRLRDGPTPYEGRIEVFKNGVWGTVCRRYSASYAHHVINAHVACRELFGSGYGGTYYPTHETPTRFGILRSGAIHASYMRCNGDEDSLLSCQQSLGGDDTSCYHEQDATVKCFPVPEGCFGYFNTDTGSVTSPEYPAGLNFTDETECIWKIETSLSSKIILAFSDVQNHGQTGNINYIQVINSNAFRTLLTSYGLPITDYTSSSSNVVFIKQKTASGSMGFDFAASWTIAISDCNTSQILVTHWEGSGYYLPSPGYLEGYPANQDCYHLVQYRDQFTAAIRFFNFHLDDDINGTCTDYVEIFDGSSVSDARLGRFCGSIVPSTVTSTQNVVLAHFHSDNVTHTTSLGYDIHMTAVGPDPVILNVTGSSGVITSPGYPDSYLNETDRVWIITVLPYLSVTISFSNFSISCVYNTRLEIREYSVHGSYLAGPCGEGVPTPVESNTNVMALRLRSASGDPKGSRFNATWEAECRREYSSSSGTITSPDGPNPYPVDLDCFYVITRESGYYITLTFTSFDLLDPPSSERCSDYITVYDGSSEFSPLLIDEFCGSSPPPLLTSTGSSMVIKFHSDGNSVAASTGFVASYVTAIKECETEALTSLTGGFQSPGFPLQYPRHTYCQWTITVPRVGGLVELTFQQFAIGRKNSFDCAGAYVRVYDGDSADASTVMDTLCGTTVVPVITSTGRSLTVVLNSFAFSPVDAVGFKASYTTVGDADIAQYDLFPFGVSEGDSVLDTSSTPSLVTVQAGIPFGDHLENDFYVAQNGLVSIGDPFTWPDLPDSRKVICVYCAYVDNGDSVGGIYYQQYTTGAVVSKATEEVREFTESSSFNATTVVLVTWDRVKQGRYRAVNFDPDQDEGEATFQLALISDGLTSYALMYYAVGRMTWRYRGRWSYVTMGVSDGEVNNYQRNIYTNTERAYSIDTVSGNTGRHGMWLYKIGEVPSSPQGVCINWLFRNYFFADERQLAFSRLPECPCSHRDVWRKTRFLWVKARSDATLHTECYRMNRASSAEHYPYGKECCYSLDPSDPAMFGQLITSPPAAGGALAFNPSYWHLRAAYEEDDRLAHDSCCHPDVSASFCLSFYLWRPVGACRTNIPFRFSWLFGDPHIITLDEREYTFNGWGEYSLLGLAEGDWRFQLQGRTSRMTTDAGSPLNATVFTAFGARENLTKVFVQLDPSTNRSLIVFGGDRDYTLLFQQEGDDFLVDEEEFTLMRDNDSLVVTFPSGISLSVAVGVRSLVLGVSMPEKFRNETKGMMGNYNGVKDDDFVLPSGETLSDSLTDREIHQQFGQAWAVTAASSVLRYGPGEGASDFAHPDFVPVFLDDASAAERQSAVRLCGAADRACIYDFLVSGSEAFAVATKRTREAALKDNADVKNTLPILHVPDNVTVTSNVPVTFNISATESDVGDTVTYRLAHDGNGALRIDPSTGEITATISHLDPVDIRVYAVDSRLAQTEVRAVPLVVCSGCSSHGQCNFSSVQQSVGSVHFQHAACVCAAGWGGADCADDQDACVSSPCHPLQSCTDLSPDQQLTAGRGYTCGACAAGYTSTEQQPNQCLDVDECADAALNGCQETCNNTQGSYRCSCPPGYRLSGDGRSCSDVNECAEKSHDCQQLCANTAGGFTCSCREGFVRQSSGACVQNATSRAACADSACQHECRAGQDPTGSTVPTCFCFSGYDLDPTDNATCVDHDECRDGTCAQLCNNTLGGFSCACYSGFRLNPDQRTCSPCPALSYGPDCRHTCACNGRAVRCHPVTGCLCRPGWTGSQCQEDVDECRESPDVCGGGRVCTNNNGSYSCACRDGYVTNSDGVCQDIDECKIDATCGQEEQCSNVPGSFSCSCLPGYQRVSTACADINECALGNAGCQHKCVNVGGSYNCECNIGYRLNADRRTCSQVSEPCKEATNLSCDHGCTLNDAAVPECFCRSGYSLQADQQSCADINECTASGAACSDTCVNSEGGFTCSCPAGKTLDNDGKTCVVCPSGRHGVNCSQACSCGAGAAGCHAVTGCTCTQGWTGPRCDVDIDECDAAGAQQLCNATCVNLQGGYRCQCADGYRLDENGSCRDVDECQSSPCAQTCENSEGSYRCLCNTGFSLNTSTGECADVDECALSVTHVCTQRCDNTAGSYRCSCDKPGFVLNNDGVTCDATAACTRTDCDVSNGGCYVNDASAETCFCNSGYALDGDGVGCTYQETNWCSTGVCSDQCAPSADGASFTCTCPRGFILNPDARTCRACPKGTYGAGCQSNCLCDAARTESCEATLGTCVCRAGWQGGTCSQDVDECGEDPAPCGQHALCRNTPGGFQCGCLPGYLGNSTGHCIACPANTFGQGCSQVCTCPSENVQSCDHVTGECRCKAGWEGSSCAEDVDECSLQVGGHDCSSNSHTRCRNTPGAYVCDCADGYRIHNGVCVAFTRLPFVFTLHVDVAKAQLTSEMQEQIQGLIFDLLSRFMTNLMAVVVRELRLGSMVAEADAVVSSDSVQSSSSGLATAMVNISGQNASVGERTGPVNFSVDSLQVSPDTPLCEVFTRYVTCAASAPCKVGSAGPQCGDVAKDKADPLGDKRMLWLIIGLGVGIPLLIVIVCVVAAVCYRCRTKGKAAQPTHDPQRGRTVNHYEGQQPPIDDAKTGRYNKGYFSGP